MGLLLPDSLMYCIKPGMRVQFFFQLSWLPTEEKALQSHGLCVPPGSSLYVDVATRAMVYQEARQNGTNPLMPLENNRTTLLVTVAP